MPKDHLVSTKVASEIFGICPRAVCKAAEEDRLEYRIKISPGGQKRIKIKISEAEFERYESQKKLAKLGELQENSKPQPFKDFEREIPDHYLRIGQLKAQLCNWILEKKKEDLPSIGKIYELAQKEFQYSDSCQELRELLKKKTISVRELQRWDSKYVKSENDFISLIPQYFSSRERKRKITDDELHLLKKQLFNSNKEKIGPSIKYIKYLAQKGEIDSPSSISTLRRAAEDLKKQYPNEYHLARYGEESFKNERLKSIIRDWDQLKVGDVLVADGHRLNFEIIDPFTGKPKRMLLIAFEDMFSRNILGASIALNEDTANISSALRMAIINLGIAPKIIYLDNGKAFGAKYFLDNNLEHELGGLYDRLGSKVIFAKPYNAKAKPIERFFQTFGDNFERKMSSFVGSSIQDRPAQLRRNELWMKKIFNDTPPTLKEAIIMINSYFTDFYAKQPHSGLNGRTPEEVFLEQKPECTISIEELDFLMLSVKNRVVSRQGIQFDKKLFWSKELVGIVKEKVTIRYDFNDLSYLKVYRNNKYICTAGIREYQSPILDTDEKKMKLNMERAEIGSIIYERKKSTKNILDEVNKNVEISQQNLIQSQHSIIDMNNKSKLPWNKNGIDHKVKFELFIEHFGKPFTLKEASALLDIDYETIKKDAQPLYDVKIIRNGKRGRSVLLEKLDKPIIEVKKSQMEIELDILPLNTAVINCHEVCQTAGTENKESTYWK